MQWLSLYFPQLALDHRLRAHHDDPAWAELALAISEMRGRRAVIHSCTDAARRQGVVPGMSTSAARNLCPELRLQPLDETRQQQALERLASHAMQFTPAISLQPPDGLLMEIGASADLFGGLASLHAQISAAVHQLGYRHVAALAPTPLAARWLSRAGAARVITTPHRLAAALRGLPVEVMELDERILAALHGMGLHRIGDCLRLPRDEGGRRLGSALFTALDRALGKRPDPRRPWLPPKRFSSRLILPEAVTSSERLLFAARRLLTELVDCLRAGNLGVREFVLRLVHDGEGHTDLPLQLAGTTRDADHLLLMLRTRLESFSLPAPVAEIVLRAETLVELAARNHELFPGPEEAQEDWLQLLNHLRMRLGDDAVQSIHAVAEHRPEYAWQAVPAPAHDRPPGLQRPLWLLDEPRPLQVVHRRPCLHGRLDILAGPERIEAGWWDGGEIRRDYYVMCNPGRQQFWVFRCHDQPGAWYLHGLFA